MKLGKWIGGIMGFMAMGPLGALAGYAIGSLFDKAAYAPENMDAGNETYTGQRNSFFVLTACHGFVHHSRRRKNHA